MKLLERKIKDKTAYLIFELERDEQDNFADKIYSRKSRNIAVPGFKKSEAPREDFIAIYGHDKFWDEVIQEYLTVHYSDITDKYLPDSGMTPLANKLQNIPLRFELVIPLKPVVQLCDYRHMKIKPESMEVSDGDVDAVLEGLRKKYRYYVKADRPVMEGDLVDVDIKGTLIDIPILSKNGLKFLVSPEYSAEFPDLYKLLIGMRQEETKKGKATISDKKTDKNLAGKDVDFEITVHEVKEVILYELDDKFASMVAPGIKTLVALKDRIRKNIKTDRIRNAEPRLQAKIMDELIKNSKLEFSPIMMEREIDGLMDLYKDGMNGTDENTDGLNDLPAFSDDELYQRCTVIARQRIFWSIIIDEVAKAEDIHVTNSEIDAEIEKAISVLDEGDKDSNRINLKNNDKGNISDLLKARKTIKRLVEIMT
jgi:trigger factor